MYLFCCIATIHDPYPSVLSHKDKITSYALGSLDEIQYATRRNHIQAKQNIIQRKRLLHYLIQKGIDHACGPYITH